MDAGSQNPITIVVLLVIVLWDHSALSRAKFGLSFFTGIIP